MSGVPPRGPGKVTLVDAFSALLAAEQGDGSAEASLTAWEPANAGSDDSGSENSGSGNSEFVQSASGHGHSDYNVSARSDSGDDAVEVAEAVELVEVEEEAAPAAAATAAGFTAAAAGAAVTSMTSAPAPAAESPAPPAQMVSQEQLEAVVRKVLGEMTDRLVQEMREVVANRVVDVAERLVREEIERLKAAAEADQA